MSTIEKATSKSLEKMENLSDDVIADFKAVVDNLEEMLKETSNQGGEKLAEMRTKAEKSLRIAKVRMEEAQEALIVRTKAAAKETDDYVHENPWQAAGIAAAIGVVLGVLISRR